MAANASGPLESLAKPCSMKPKPTISRNGIGAHRAIGNRPGNSNAMSRKDFLGLAVGFKIVFIFNLFRMAPKGVSRARESASYYDAGALGVWSLPQTLNGGVASR